jgi:hypothetical protein
VNTATRSEAGGVLDRLAFLVQWLASIPLQQFDYTAEVLFAVPVCMTLECNELAAKMEHVLSITADSTKPLVVF